MIDMDAFKIRERANGGQRLPLTLLDGSATDHWLHIRSQWSDAFRQARDAALQEAAKLAQGGEALLQATLDESLLAVRAALVSDWSFSEPCTHDNVCRFLREAPQIAEQVDQVSANDAAFFGNAFANSPSG
jgi:hypothetical protein